MKAIALLLVLAALAGCTLDRRGLDRRCPRHDLVLQDDLVPILWGLPFVEERESKAREERFPRACSVYSGGCVPGPESRAWVRYCPACRDAETLWRKENERR